MSSKNLSLLQTLVVSLYLAVITLACAESLTHTIAKEEKIEKGENPYHPDGYKREYPVFADHKIAALINKDVQDVIESYSCIESGMSEVSVKISFQTEKLLSLSYHAYYMCDAMPRHSGSNGVLNYNLSDNKKITLAELIKPDALDDFLADAIQKINKLTDNPELNELIRCKVEGPLNFYFTEEGMTVFYEAKPFGFLACNGEVSYEKKMLAKLLSQKFQ